MTEPAATKKAMGGVERKYSHEFFEQLERENEERFK